MATQGERARSTIDRLSNAIRKEQYDVAQQIIESLSESDAKYVLLAISLVQFGVIK